MKKILRVVFFSLLVGIIGGIVAIFTTDIGYSLRETAAEIILSSQHRYLAKYLFLPKEDTDRILKNISNPKYVNSVDVNNKAVKENLQKEQAHFPRANDNLVVKVETIEKRYSAGYYYKGKILTVNNPNNIKLVPSSLSQHGEQIHIIAKRVDALAATNASGFVDLNGHGNGGASTGVVIENGVVKSDSRDAKSYVAGFTSKGKMITGFYSADELINFGVKQAAGFRPQLIVNGKKMITEGDGGWGIGPRTAIGQKSDGTVMLVVIDGRQQHSIGATIKEVQDILYDRGAINAMSMDGGSSSSMYFNGENITIPSSRNHIPRYLPNIWAVIPNAHQHVRVYDEGKLVKKW